MGSIVCVHGMFTDGSCFKKMVSTFQMSRIASSVFYPTLPHHGISISDEPEKELANFSFYDGLDFMRDFIAPLEGPLTLIGHSMGAVIAEMLAAEDDGKIEKIILLNPAPVYGVFALSFSAIRSYWPIITSADWQKNPIARTEEQTINSIANGLTPKDQEEIASRSCWSSGRMFKDLRDGVRVPAGKIHCDKAIFASSNDRIVVPRVSSNIAKKFGAPIRFFDLPHFSLYDIGLRLKVSDAVKNRERGNVLLSA